MPPRAPAKGVPQKRPFWNRGLQWAFVLSFFLAPILAVLIQLARAPDEEPLPETTVRPRALAPFIAGLLANTQSSNFECSLEEINLHLSHVLPAGRKVADGLLFQRLTLRLEPGGCTAHAAYQWRGREWQSRIHYEVQVQGGRLRLRADSASLGRIHLGTFSIQNLEAPLLKLLPHLKRETVLLNRLESIRIEKDRVSLKLRPSTPLASP
jgi:hypothetical protein